MAPVFLWQWRGLQTTPFLFKNLGKYADGITKEGFLKSIANRQKQAEIHMILQKTCPSCGNNFPNRFLFLPKHRWQCNNCKCELKLDLKTKFCIMTILVITLTPSLIYFFSINIFPALFMYTVVFLFIGYPYMCVLRVIFAKLEPLKK